MEGMFYNCYSLTSLNLSNFIISNVKQLNEMFYNCTSLNSLDLSNFDTSNVTNITNFFYNCKNLEYINLAGFSEVSLISYENMFYNVPDNVVICINQEKNQNKTMPQIKTKTCFNIDCSTNWKLKQKRVVNETDICVQYCRKSSPYDNDEKCFKNCLNESTIDENNKCQCELDGCLLCPQEISNQNLCKKCKGNFYPIINDFSNMGEYINCYKELKGFYLDNKDIIYKKCYSSCKECKIGGNITNHNCLLCDDNYSYKISLNNNYWNCFEKCRYYHYFDSNNNYHCTLNSSCPKEYEKLLPIKNECIKLILNNNAIKNKIQNIINFSKNESNNDIVKEEEREYYDTIIEIIEESFTSEYYDTSNLDKGKNEIIEAGKMTISFTTAQNQKNNSNTNMTTIDLGECDTLLRNHYNISDNQTLYIKKQT